MDKNKQLTFDDTAEKLNLFAVMNSALQDMEAQLKKFRDDLDRNYDCGDPCIMEQGRIKGAEKIIEVFKKHYS